jgi:polyisoprenyl-phosphate glycosyltransferase
MSIIKLSVIIPVYRGKEILFELFRRINEALEANFDYEVLLICDGCDPDSSKITDELKQRYSSHIKVFRLAKNYGQHRALQFGFSKASGDLIVTIDEDLQHDPADIINLISKQQNGDFDIVYGRFINHLHNGTRNFMSAILRKILKYFIPTLYEDYSPYRLIKKDIAVRTSTMVCPYTFIDDFLSRITQNIAFVDIDHHKRYSGNSSYTLGKLFKHGIYILLAYSGIISWLLSLAGILMISGTLLSLLKRVYPVTGYISKIHNVTIFEIIGVAFLLVLISLFGTLINHRNIRLNTRQVKLADEGAV